MRFIYQALTLPEEIVLLTAVMAVVSVFLLNNLNFRLRNDLQSENLELRSVNLVQGRS